MVYVREGEKLRVIGKDDGLLDTSYNLSAQAVQRMKRKISRGMRMFADAHLDRFEVGMMDVRGLRRTHSEPQN
jgi:hypothetical protein